jgi:hypothetical protein
MIINNPSLVFYCFTLRRYFLKTSSGSNSLSFLQELWAHCAKIGIKDKSENIDLPVSFPQINDSPFMKFSPRALMVDDKRKKKGEDFQAYIFEYGDVIGLVVSLETNQKNKDLESLASLYGIWTKNIPLTQLQDEYFYENFLFNGELTEESFSNIKKAPSNTLYDSILLKKLETFIKGKLTSDIQKEWDSLAHDTREIDGVIFERKTGNNLNFFGILTPPSPDIDIFEWTIWESRAQLPIFTRCALNASKIHYSNEVIRRQLPEIHSEIELIDQELNRLLGFQYGIGLSNSVPAHLLEFFQIKLNYFLSKNNALIDSLSRLRETQVTVDIGERNLKNLLAESFFIESVRHSSIFDPDLLLARWLKDQIDVEIKYIDALRERVEVAKVYITDQISIEAEKNARKLNRLILIQGTILGALAVMLTAVQSLQIQVLVNNLLKWELVAILGLFALGIPPLIVTSEESIHPVIRYIVKLLGGASLFFFYNLWSAYFPIILEVSALSWYLGAIASFILGYFTAELGMNVFYRFRNKTHKSTLGVPIIDEELQIWMESFLTKLPGVCNIIEESDINIKVINNKYERYKQSPSLESKSNLLIEHSYIVDSLRKNKKFNKNLMKELGLPQNIHKEI